MDEWTTGLAVALGVEFRGIFHGRVVLKQEISLVSSVSLLLLCLTFKPPSTEPDLFSSDQTF